MLPQFGVDPDHPEFGIVYSTSRTDLRFDLFDEAEVVDSAMYCDVNGQCDCEFVLNSAPRREESEDTFRRPLEQYFAASTFAASPELVLPPTRLSSPKTKENEHFAKMDSQSSGMENDLINADSQHKIIYPKPPEFIDLRGKQYNLKAAEILEILSQIIINDAQRITDALVIAQNENEKHFFNP